jgi:hypothetical protein
MLSKAPLPFYERGGVRGKARWHALNLLRMGPQAPKNLFARVGRLQTDLASALWGDQYFPHP